MSLINTAQFNISRIIFFILIYLSLSACNLQNLDSLNATTLSGSVGDGPITNARIVVTDSRGIVIGETISDSTANYTVSIDNGSKYPLLITATGGTDLVTGAEPDFTLLSVATDSKKTTGNINPFSTLIVKTAQAMPG